MKTSADSRTSHDSTGLSPGQVVAGKYRIDAVLGEGGMGKVYAAENLRTGKSVALKYVLAAGAEGLNVLQRFAREARAAGRIHHPNVIDIYDVVEDENGTCLVMERLEGESLDELVDREAPLSVELAVSILIDASRGVAAAHGEGVIHRDIKPPNIYLCVKGGPSRVKVLDFGVSKVLSDVDAQPVTVTGAVVGTPHYMAPEQVRGKKDIDSRVDVYALGAVLFEMLAGRPPFTAQKVTALLVSIATDEAPAVSSLRSDVPPELDALIARALAKDPDDRFEDVASFASALEPFGDGTTFEGEGKSWTNRVSTGGGRKGSSGMSQISTVGADTRSSGERIRPSTSDLAPPPSDAPESSEVVTPPPSRGSMIWVAVSIAALLLAGAIWWGTRGPDDSPSAGAPPDETVTAEDQASATEPPEATEATSTEEVDTPPAERLDAEDEPLEPSPEEGSTVEEPIEVADGPAAEVPSEAEPRRRRGRRSRRSGGRSSTTNPRAGDMSLDDF